MRVANKVVLFLAPVVMMGAGCATRTGGSGVAQTRAGMSEEHLIAVAQMHEAQGREQSAMRLYREALRVNPRSEVAEQRMTSLSEAGAGRRRADDRTNVRERLVALRERTRSGAAGDATVRGGRMQPQLAQAASQSGQPKPQPQPQPTRKKAPQMPSAPQMAQTAMRELDSTLAMGTKPQTADNQYVDAQLAATTWAATPKSKSVPPPPAEPQVPDATQPTSRQPKKLMAATAATPSVTAQDIAGLPHPTGPMAANDDAVLASVEPRVWNTSQRDAGSIAEPESIEYEKENHDFSTDWAEPDAAAAPSSLVDLCDDPNASILREIAKLESDDAAARKAGLVNLAGMGREAFSAGPAIKTLFDDKDPMVQAHAAWAAWSVDGDDAAPVNKLAELLSHNQQDLQQFCAYVLGDIGAPAVDALPGLRQMMTSSDATIRVQAAEAIARIDATDASVVTTLATAAKHESADVRSTAVFALGSVDSQHASQVVPVLTTALGDRSAQVQSAAALTLGGMGSAAIQAVSHLEAATKAVDPEVREAASTALMCIQ